MSHIQSLHDVSVKILYAFSVAEEIARRSLKNGRSVEEACVRLMMARRRKIIHGGLPFPQEKDGKTEKVEVFCALQSKLNKELSTERLHYNLFDITLALCEGGLVSGESLSAKSLPHDELWHPCIQEQDTLHDIAFQTISCNDKQFCFCKERHSRRAFVESCDKAK